jgi:hypothetical protein
VAVLQAKCAGTSLRYLLHNRTLGVLAKDTVCIPTYTHDPRVRRHSSLCSMSQCRRHVLLSRLRFRL